jgi:pyruvate kinase
MTPWRVHELSPMKRRTKIVCTLGPAVDSKSGVRRLIAAGMNVARVNCSYGDWETRSRWIRWVRELSREIAPCGILIDLQGPKFRIGRIPEGVRTIAKGDEVILGTDNADVLVPHRDLLRAMTAGDRLLLGDGNVSLRVQAVSAERVSAQVMTGGSIRSGQGIALSGRTVWTPSLTPKDVADVEEACRHSVDFIALSYVREPGDVRSLRGLVAERDSGCRICAKIETREALLNLEPIVDESDLVMVARGDLGLQLSAEEVPIAQKRIISVCNRAGVPVITATQMLESMVRSPLPTRAEVADIANAMLDGSDALMLSGETATGEYPCEAVRTMARVAVQAESIFGREAHRLKIREGRPGSGLPADAIARAAVDIAELTRASAIVITTTSGQTARFVCKYRPVTEVLCAAYSGRTASQLSVVWGAEAVALDLPKDTDASVEQATRGFVARKRLKCGDRIVVTAGVPAGVPGNTNLVLTRLVDRP